jgi:acetyl esterase/lipase
MSVRNVCIEKDLIFDEREPVLLKADIYYSKPQEKLFPALINVHGGGFVEGDKKYRRGYALTMAREGFLVMNINYGLCPEHKLPFILDNVISAFNFLIENSERYNIDRNRILISGDSSGAFISAVAAGVINNGEFRKKLNIDRKPLGRIRGALLYCGMYDLKTVCLNTGAFKDSIDYADIVMGKKYEELEQDGTLNLIEPDNYINSSYPPVFITYATKDMFCHDTSGGMLEALVMKKIKHEVFVAENYTDIHCYHLRPMIRNARKCNKISHHFIKSILK